MPGEAPVQRGGPHVVRLLQVRGKDVIEHQAAVGGGGARAASPPYGSQQAEARVGRYLPVGPVGAVDPRAERERGVDGRRGAARAQQPPVGVAMLG